MNDYLLTMGLRSEPGSVRLFRPSKTSEIFIFFTQLPCSESSKPLGIILNMKIKALFFFFFSFGESCEGSGQ